MLLASYPTYSLWTNARPEQLFSRLRFSLTFLLFAIGLSGCATFLGNDLPAYTFADLPPAPPLEKRTCLIVSYKDDCDKACHESNDPINEMLEKSIADVRREPRGAKAVDCW